MTSENIAKVISSLGWPQITFILALIFILLFKKPISDLLTGIKQLSKDGISFNPLSVELQVDKKRQQDLEELLSIENSIVIQEIEKNLQNELLNKNLAVEGDTIKVLIKHLAFTQLELDFEKIYNSIFGSQIYLLKKLNEVRDTGKQKQFIDEYYTDVKEKHEVFKDWDVEKYCLFLFSNTLITMNNNIVNITIKGNEFLTWMIKRGKDEEKIF